MRRFFVIAAALAVLVLPAAAQQEKITRDCGENIHFCNLALSGEISAGDAYVIEQAIRTSPRPIDLMTADSPGGDAFEALKISAILNKYFVPFMAGFRNGNGDRVIGTGGDCASACALVWITSDQRMGTEVFLHRPTFAPEMFRQMTASQAEAAYQTATAQLTAQLRQRGVPNSDIELIMSVPSDSLRKIDESYPQESTWMTEWLTAKCGSLKGEENAELSDAKTADDFFLLGNRGRQCRSKVRAEAQLAAQTKVR